MGKMIEVDEEEVRANSKLRETIASWMKNPQARRKLLEANKAFDPKADIPELDRPDPVEERFAAQAKELAEFKKETADREAARERTTSLQALESSIEKGIDKLRREHRLTDDGVAEIRKIMNDEGIVKPEIAWSHFQATHPPQNPITPNGSGAWGFMDAPTEGSDGAEDIKALIMSKGENENLVRNMAHKALKDIRAA